jgi:hypothetical protein
MTSRGYGVFFDHTDLISLEIQSEKLAKVNVTIQGEEIRWFVIYGPTPKEVWNTVSQISSIKANKLSDTSKVHDAHGKTLDPATVELRTIPLDFVLDRIRRKDGHDATRRHAIAGNPDVCPAF